MKRTWGMIKSEAIHLGFEKTTAYQKNKSIFIEAANRAIQIIAMTVKPVAAKYKLTHNPIPNLLGGAQMLATRQYTGKPITFSARDVKAYYFEWNGNGILTIAQNGQEQTIELSSTGEFTAYKGFAQGEVSLCFRGEHAFSIRNVALYGLTYSENEEDIPAFGRYIAYDFGQLTKENGQTAFFGFLDETPVIQTRDPGKDTWRTVTDYKIDGNSTILLSRFDEGQFEIWYKKYPRPITQATPDDYEIDLDYDASLLVPLLMGYYIWLDDDERKAILYRNDYEDRKNELLSYLRRVPVAQVAAPGKRRWE